MNAHHPIAVWRVNFVAGLAVVLPVVLSIAVLVWLFGTVANITDRLLFFLPRHWVHTDGGTGPIYWYWSVVALLWAVLLVSLIGRTARHYLGRKLIQLLDQALLSIPLLNKIYGTIKQVNDAFSSGSKSAFRQVVLVEFPKAGFHSLGFVTGEQPQSLTASPGPKTLSVFVPTTPNPTTGFLLIVPENQVTRIEMPVADAIRFIISLGAVPTDFPKPGPLPPAS